MHLLEHSCSCSPYDIVLAISKFKCIFGKVIMFSIQLDAFECFNERNNHYFHFAC